MQQYLTFLQYILDHGQDQSDRTGVGVRSIFSYEMRFDLSKGFPLVTTKKIYLPALVHELLWFLKGDTNIRYLNEHGVHIWDPWADKNGDLGPIYGKQWRSWECRDGQTVDQLSQLLHEIRHNPDSRRLVVSAWNVGELHRMALPPCHLLFQFYVLKGRLSCKLTQRSADAFLGVPFNIASYALLTHLIAQQCDCIPGEFIWSGGHCHVYANHFEAAYQQLSRDPKPPAQLIIKRKPPSIDDYQYADFEFHYDCHPAIKAPIAV